MKRLFNRRGKGVLGKCKITKQSKMFHTDLLIILTFLKINLTTISGFSDFVGKWSSSLCKVKDVYPLRYSESTVQRGPVQGCRF